MYKLLNNDEFEMEEVIEPKTGLKFYKRVIKKDAAAKLLEEHKIKGIQKFIYFDEYRNLEIFDKKPEDAHLCESFP